LSPGFLHSVLDARGGRAVAQNRTGGETFVRGEVLGRGRNHRGGGGMGAPALSISGGLPGLPRAAIVPSPRFPGTQSGLTPGRGGGGLLMPKKLKKKKKATTTPRKEKTRRWLPPTRTRTTPVREGAKRRSDPVCWKKKSGFSETGPDSSGHPFRHPIVRWCRGQGTQLSVCPLGESKRPTPKAPRFFLSGMAFSKHFFVYENRRFISKGWRPLRGGRGPGGPPAGQKPKHERWRAGTPSAAQSGGLGGPAFTRSAGSPAGDSRVF